MKHSKTEIEIKLSALRAELATMHTRPALSMVKYVALSQETVSYTHLTLPTIYSV